MKKANESNDQKEPVSASGIPVHCAFDRLADVTELIPQPRNPQKHGDAQVALLAKIIRHTGWRAPIVVSKRSGFVVAGHGRLQAAKLLCVEKVPVNDQDFATEADEWAHVVADNRISELAETDGGMLKEILTDLDTGAFDMEMTGFSMDEMERVINSYKDDSPKQSDDDYSLFELVMLHENKKDLMDTLNQIKERDGLDKNEDALMTLVKLHCS